jgi:hypothetical protein
VPLSTSRRGAVCEILKFKSSKKQAENQAVSSMAFSIPRSSTLAVKPSRTVFEIMGLESKINCSPTAQLICSNFHRK